MEKLLLNLELCVQRYNVYVNDMKRLKQVIEAIKKNEEQKIIVCHVFIPNRSIALNIGNITRQLKVSGRNWIKNLFFFPENMQERGVFDGTVILLTGIKTQYNVSNAEMTLKVVKTVTWSLTYHGRSEVLRLMESLNNNVSLNYFYTNKSEKESYKIK